MRFSGIEHFILNFLDFLWKKQKFGQNDFLIIPPSLNYIPERYLIRSDRIICFKFCFQGFAKKNILCIILYKNHYIFLLHS